MKVLMFNFFSPTEIPWNKLAFPSTKEALRDYIDKIVTPRNTSKFPNQDNKTKIGNDRKQISHLLPVATQVVFLSTLSTTKKEYSFNSKLDMNFFSKY